MSRLNPHRISEALDSAGLYGPEVDKMLGVEEPTVDHWEVGYVEPSPAQLRRLSILTGYPLAFFYRPDRPPFRGWLCGENGCEYVDDQNDAPCVEFS